MTSNYELYRLTYSHSVKSCNNYYNALPQRSQEQRDEFWFHVS